MQLPTFATGTTRAVLCVGSLAFKIARSASGARGNRYEADLYRRSDQQRKALLCPPLWCSRNGAVLIMRRAHSMTCDEYIEQVRDAGLMLLWDYRRTLGDGSTAGRSRWTTRTWISILTT
jgi:hypothetical protein